MAMNTSLLSALAKRLPEPVVSPARTVLRAPAVLLHQRIVPRAFGLRVRHVSGPRDISYASDEVLAISVVRDGELHIAAFLDHHLALGVRHIVLLDNGSTDRTVEVARSYDRVTILRTDAPYAHYENVMKRYLARRFSRGRWNLMVDVDERFDYPFSATVPLPAVIRYLNRHGYTAVVAHMLDLFPNGVLRDLAGAPEGHPEDSHDRYDLASIRARPYRWGNPGDHRIKEYKGGIRHALFGIDCGLTKAPLVRVDGEIEIFVGWHHTRRACIADFDCVLRHYPFAGFHSKVRDAVDTGRYGQFSQYYRMYRDVLRARPDAPMSNRHAHRYRDAEALLEQGFLVASERFARWAREEARS